MQQCEIVICLVCKCLMSQSGHGHAVNSVYKEIKKSYVVCNVIFTCVTIFPRNMDEYHKYSCKMTCKSENPVFFNVFSLLRVIKIYLLQLYSCILQSRRYLCDTYNWHAQKMQLVKGFTCNCRSDNMPFVTSIKAAFLLLKLSCDWSAHGISPPFH